jgi:hypothetical protein
MSCRSRRLYRVICSCIVYVQGLRHKPLQAQPPEERTRDCGTGRC